MYFESFGLSIDGNILTHHNIKRSNMMFFIDEEYEQITIRVASRNDGEVLYDISYPMNEYDHQEFAGLIHQASSKNMLDKLRKKTDTGPNPDGTPPSGGTPGASRVVNFVKTTAVAA